MFNPKFFGDLLINNASSGPLWTQNFAGPGTAVYQKFLALNFGLGGLFTPLTPKQLIEGYTDSKAEYFKNKPVYVGGDASIPSSFMVDPPNRLSMSDNYVSMFTGETDDDLVRTFSLWNNKPYNNVPMTDYATTKTTTTTLASPWSTQVDITGTDGAQFQPDSAEETLSLFVSGLCRTMNLTSAGVATGTGYDQLTIYNFELDQASLNANPTYNSVIDGTSPMEMINRFPSYATQGHYYNVSPSASGSIPVITAGSSGAPVTPSKSADSTMFQVEQLSGLTTMSQTTW